MSNTMRCPTCHRSAPVLGGVMQAHLTAEGTPGERQCSGVGKPQRPLTHKVAAAAEALGIPPEEAAKIVAVASIPVRTV